jgi:hypothetical protein
LRISLDRRSVKPGDGLGNVIQRAMVMALSGVISIQWGLMVLTITQGFLQHFLQLANSFGHILDKFD